jgi:hypothetical protein
MVGSLVIVFHNWLLNWNRAEVDIIINYDCLGGSLWKKQLHVLEIGQCYLIRNINDIPFQYFFIFVASVDPLSKNKSRIIIQKCRTFCKQLTLPGRTVQQLPFFKTVRLYTVVFEKGAKSKHWKSSFKHRGWYVFARRKGVKIKFFPTYSLNYVKYVLTIWWNRHRRFQWKENMTVNALIFLTTGTFNIVLHSTSLYV